MPRIWSSADRGVKRSGVVLYVCKTSSGGAVLMTNDLRFKRLERARLAGLVGEYEAAYQLLDVLLAHSPGDIEVRRLYGNILEMHAFFEKENLPMSAKLRCARAHYRQIIKTDPANHLAIFDLAEHFANIGKIQ